MAVWGLFPLWNKRKSREKDHDENQKTSQDLKRMARLKSESSLKGKPQRNSAQIKIGDKP